MNTHVVGNKNVDVNGMNSIPNHRIWRKSCKQCFIIICAFLDHTLGLKSVIQDFKKNAQT